ncbi:hypothetical protein [Streptomyces hyaluromycini]|uniref:hypothetical protein n=1 Tax=Streptomyces hyaluromycini TaxID=1377993 RepID=UPI000B5CB8D5|nr:hypothetical protein [Streptomyces hyaluromycini]
MGDFLGAVTAFPTVVFSFALFVVAVYWLLVLLGGAHFHGARGGHHGHGHGHGGGRHGHGGLQKVLGLGGVPITVAVSLVVAFAWFSALSGRVVFGSGHGGVLLPAALAGGWAGARLLAWPLRRLMPAPAPPPSRRDFVGLGCVIRTGRVGPDFGQAEVRAADGSSAVVQVRQSLDDAAGPGGVLRTGASALIYDYDDAGEYFWVMPAVPASG